jgi:hypothetical protein
LLASLLVARSWCRRTAANIAVQGMPQEMMTFEEGHMMSKNQEAAASASSEAVDRLAKRLYSDLIKLDPVEGDPEWSALPDIDRHFYRQLIEDLVRSPDLALVGLPTKINVDRKNGGRIASERRTPWVVSFIGLLLVAAGLYVGFNMAFDVVEDFVCNITGRADFCDGR